MSELARRRKLAFFSDHLTPEMTVLDVGCADGWFSRWAAEQGIHRVTGIDRIGPADVVGDVKEWASLGLQAGSFDAAVAFEVVEHDDIADALHALIAPGGVLLATTPVPRLDWACRALEGAHLLQQRTSAHSHLVDLREYPRFRCERRVVRGLVAQWAVLRPA